MGAQKMEKSLGEYVWKGREVEKFSRLLDGFNNREFLGRDMGDKGFRV